MYLMAPKTGSQMVELIDVMAAYLGVVEDTGRPERYTKIPSDISFYEITKELDLAFF